MILFLAFVVDKNADDLSILPAQGLTTFKLLLYSIHLILSTLVLKIDPGDL